MAPVRDGGISLRPRCRELGGGRGAHQRGDQRDPQDHAVAPVLAPFGAEGQADAKEKKLSALDAAAKVLAEEGRPMSCQELIDAMAAKGCWTSPGGKTPAATLYSAILRELTKGSASRFVKTERGKFTRQG